MKANSIVILAMLMAMMPITLSAQVKPELVARMLQLSFRIRLKTTQPQGRPECLRCRTRDRKELLQEYEAEMQAITQDLLQSS